jgi:hypothetical protein
MIGGFWVLCSENVANLTPLADGGFVNNAAAKPHLVRRSPPLRSSHHQVVPAGLYEVIEYCRNRRMIE